MESEQNRLDSFENFPCTFMNVALLSQTGMYFTGENDQCACYFCEVKINRWEHGDDPVTEHSRFSLNCPLLRRRHTANIPLDAAALDAVLPPASYDVCGPYDVHPPPSVARPYFAPTTVENVARQMPRQSHFYSLFTKTSIKSHRLVTFKDWPAFLHPRPEQLAEAGFFYYNYSDHVKCYSCNLHLKDWQPNDDPWKEHAILSKDCKFMKLMKGDAYIEAARNENHMRKSTIVEKSNISKAVYKKENKVLATPQSIVNTAVTTTTKTVKQEGDAKLCKICFEADYNTVFIPCGHIIACSECALSLTKCVICSKPLDDIIKIFIC